MSVTHTYKPYTKVDAVKAHINLGKKILNPQEYWDLARRYRKGHGLTYSDQHVYLGPFNPMYPAGARAYNQADYRGFLHDKSYHEFEQTTGKRPYMYYHDSDDELIKSMSVYEPDELLAKYAFLAKKGIHNLGLIDHANTVSINTTDKPYK